MTQSLSVDKYQGEPETRSLPRPKQGSIFTGKERAPHPGGLSVVQFLFVCFYLKSPCAAQLVVGTGIENVLVSQVPCSGLSVQSHLSTCQSNFSGATFASFVVCKGLGEVRTEKGQKRGREAQVKARKTGVLLSFIYKGHPKSLNHYM